MLKMTDVEMRKTGEASTGKRFMAMLTALLLAGPMVTPARAATDPAETLATATPIKHLVVIFNENISFDHYFGTYPVATNPAGEPPSRLRRGRRR